jgi:hypothetical protein
MNKKDRVRLTMEEHQELEGLLARGKADVRKLKHAQILLKADEAQRLAERLEVHHTPKHGSWLNMAEIELSALARQCLSRRIARQDTLARQVERWQADRNAASVKITWQFTTADARIRVRSLYPSFDA